MRKGIVLALAMCLGPACGGETGVSGGPKSPEGVVRNNAISHEPCNADKGSAVSAGQRGPELRTKSEGGRLVCRVTDMNHDGKPDFIEHFDGSGNVRRREVGFDDTGVAAVIEMYEGGKLVLREKDTTGQHKLDTWDYYEGGRVDSKGAPKPSRRERDSNLDGRIDQWWVWEGDHVTITMDKNGDGKPDPEATLVLGEDGRPIPSGGSSSGPDAGSPSSSERTGDGGASGASSGHDGGAT